MNLLKAGDYIENLLKIRTKDGALVPLKLNRPQRRLYDAFAAQWAAGKPVRILILKARQMGFSTLTAGLLFFLTITMGYQEALIVAHKDEATANLYRMYRRFYENLPPALRPQVRASNAQELDFDKPSRSGSQVEGLHSRIRCATAGGEGVGRSYTLQFLHLSEFAFWPGDKLETYAGLAQAVPDRPGTAIIIESTANGYEQFKAMWDAAEEAQRRGEEGYLPVFFPWFEMEEYRREPPPGFQLTEEERGIAERFGLDLEQMAWRRWCIAVNCGGDLNLFHQEYPATPEEAFLATGACFFDQEAVAARRSAVREDHWERGRFRLELDEAERIRAWHWEKDKQGEIRIHKQPEEGVPYVIGADTAGEGSDFFAAHVLDNRTGEQVAVLHMRLGERAFAQQLYALGMYYSEALVGVETNFSTYPQLKLEELGYRRFYVRERYDSFTGKTMTAYGFATTSRTRQTMLDALKDVAEYELQLIGDFETLGEMLTFVRDEKGRPAAEEGEHDDLIMSLAIAHAIRGQQRTVIQGRGARWTDDQWADFQQAGPEQRKELLRLWGTPEEGI